MSDKTVILITGANRGIGLEFVRQLAERDADIIGTYRDEGRATKLLAMADDKANVHAVKGDVTDSEALKQIAALVSDKFGKLEWLINNAGINLKYSESIENVAPEDLMENFRVNVVGPFVGASALMELLAKGSQSRIVNISSQMGSIARVGGNAVPYCISKAALNMLTKLQALGYDDKGILAVALHPGWVRTDMGGKDATLSPLESVGSMLRVIDGLTRENSGGFYSYTGDALEY